MKSAFVLDLICHGRNMLSREASRVQKEQTQSGSQLCEVLATLFYSASAHVGGWCVLSALSHLPTDSVYVSVLIITVFTRGNAS